VPLQLLAYHTACAGGTDVDKPRNLAKSVTVECSEIERAILVCGTGVGMSIAANRHAAVRAVVCSEPLSARMSRQHNDANVLCIGARIVGAGTAIDIVDAFLGAAFEGGRHAARVAKINPA
jgi:ribose 5-phosphate isomerase B